MHGRFRRAVDRRYEQESPSQANSTGLLPRGRCERPTSSEEADTPASPPPSVRSTQARATTVAESQRVPSRVRRGWMPWRRWGLRPWVGIEWCSATNHQQLTSNNNNNNNVTSPARLPLHHARSLGICLRRSRDGITLTATYSIRPHNSQTRLGTFLDRRRRKGAENQERLIHRVSAGDDVDACPRRRSTID